MTFDWREVWDRKGNSQSDDIVYLTGLDKLGYAVDLEESARILSRVLDIKPQDLVLEIGCAAGSIARFLDCKYVGVDRSEPMVKKNISLNRLSAMVCEADNLIFKDKSFDKVFVFSVFQYFPDLNYARQVINEIERVARKAAYIGDLPLLSHDPNHCIYTREFFSGWTETEALYPRENRFSIVKKFTDAS